MGIDRLSPAQRQQAEAVFPGDAETSALLAAVEATVGKDRVGEDCPCRHCGTPGTISRGKARGLRRYQCKGCNKTFNAATSTPTTGTSLSGLQRKDKWLALGSCLADRQTVRASAERCGLAVNTALRWAAPVSYRKRPQSTQAHGHCGSRALWKPMTPMCRKAGKGHEALSARRDAGQAGREAGPASGVCQMNRFRSGLPLIAATRQSVRFSLRSTPIPWPIPCQR